MELQVGILQYLESMRNEIFTVFLTTTTMMAETFFLVSIITLLYWCVNKEKSKRLAWMVLGSQSVNGLVKGIIKMPRPFSIGVVSPIRVQTATGYSFPSGHTQAATSFWGASMIVLKNKGVIILGSILIVLTAFSRLYLGVHWPMDVVGGILFGIATILIMNRLLNEAAEFNKWHVIGVSMFFLIVLALPLGDSLAQYAATLWGFAVGCYFEQKYIKFIPQASWRVQIIKIIIGFVGMVMIYGGLKVVFPAHKVFHMMRYSLVILWITAGAPYLFSKIKYK